MAESKKNTPKKPRDRVSVLLYSIYALMLAVSVVLFGKIIYIQVMFQPDPEIKTKLTPRNIKVNVEAARGNILSRDGRLLAMTFPVYDVHIDCRVASNEVWNEGIEDLAKGLSDTFKDRGAKEYKSYLCKGRKKSSSFLPICKGIDLYTMHKLEALPILEKGRYKGGLIVQKRNSRHYPFGNMGRRTIGFVRISDGKITNTHVGLEGKFDYELHGTDGTLWQKMTDYGVVQNFDSTYVKPEDGMDIRSTIDIDFQTIADRALRAGISEESDLEGGCCVVMDVKTGAIRAMVNLLRNPKNGGNMEEISNLAIGRKGEPGSVFKTTNLMIMLENGYIHSLSETIPTNRGVLEGYQYEPDEHILDWERSHGNRIPIIEGFKVSSNYMFRYLAVKNYGKNPEKYISNLYMYHLGEAFDFDIDGLAQPTLPDPKSKYWSKTNLTGAAIGYSVDETPLHILMFYNAIANKGQMMKPYLVEDIERNGIVEKPRGKSILNASICSKATADTITRALMAVTQEGTAQRLKGAKCTVAGKTGTSRVALPQGGYFDNDGKKKNQGTFVGFFPAEDPQYSIICVVYSYLSNRSFYGGTIPAAVVRRVVDEIYEIDPHWQSKIQKRGEVPKMTAPGQKAKKTKDGRIILPDLSGMGIKDVIFMVENLGLSCDYSGTGHVCGQIPAAGTPLRQGETIKIELR